MARRKPKPVTYEGNKASVTVTWKSIVGSKCFALGYADAHKGRPFREWRTAQDGWNYERGRLFAALYGGPLKINRRVCHHALVAFRDAYVAKEIL